MELSKIEESPKMDIEALVTVRDYRSEDKNFVISTWLRGYYYGNSAILEIPKDIFMVNYNKFLNAIIDGSKVRIRVACLKEDADVILSYIVTDTQEKTVHWVFSKAAWRKIGLAKKLMPKEVTFVTHLTNVGRTLLKKLPSIKYNPFISSV